jgi:hypothetical protein
LLKNDARLAIAMSSSRYIRFIEAAGMDGRRGFRKTASNVRWIQPRSLFSL